MDEARMVIRARGRSSPAVCGRPTRAASTRLWFMDQPTIPYNAFSGWHRRRQFPMVGALALQPHRPIP